MAGMPADDETPRGSGRPRRRWVTVWTIAAAVGAVGAAILPHLDIRGVAAIPVVQALVPLGAVALLLLAVASLAVRAWIAALILFAGATLAGAPALTPLQAGPFCESDRPLTVLSFNAKLSAADPAELADLVRVTSPDVVILLETDERLIAALRGGGDLAGELPYRTREVGAGAATGSVILSAYPLSREEDVPGSEFDQVSAVAALPGGGEIRVAAVHPPPPVWQPNGWYAGIEAIDDWAGRAPDRRLVIAGDFNASFAHPVLRRMASGLRDAAEAAGPIPWATWPEGKPVPPFTAIDHVFARGATPVGWESFAVEGSDHRAVVARWELCD